MAVSGKVILLKNDQALRAQDAAGDAVSLFKLDSSSKLQLLKLPQVSADPSEANDLARKSFIDAQFLIRDGRLDAIEGDVSTLEGQMSVVQGDDLTAGSIAKAKKDAQDYVDQKISDLVNGAPELLDTLQELAAAIGNDPSIATTIANSIGLLDGRLDVLEGDELTSGSVANAVKAERDRAEAAEGALDGRLDTAEGDIDALEVRMGSAETAIQNLASSSAIVDLDARVDQLEADMPTKASQSDFDALEGRVDSAEASLLLKASQSDLDSVEGRMDAAEASLLLKASEADLQSEISRAQSAEQALDGRLDIVEERDSFREEIVFNDAAAVYADGQPAVEDPSAILREGWYYQNSVAGQKINWYFFDGINQATVPLSEMSAYAVMTMDSNASTPIMAIYTKPTGSSDIMPGFAHSRVVYGTGGSMPSVQVGKKYLVYFGTEPKVHPSLPRVQLAKVSAASLGQQGNAEEVLTVSFGSNSGASVNLVKFMVERLGVSAVNFKSEIMLKIRHAEKAEHDALAARVSTAESDISGKASSSVVSAIDARLVTAEGEIDTLQSDMAGKASQTDLDAAEADIVQLQTDVAAKASQTDLDAAEADIVQLQTDVALKANSSDVSTSLSSKADLVGGKIPQSQIPSIAIVDTFEASSEAAMLALSSAEQGDVCIRSDLNKTFILASGSYDTLANWKELKTPTDAVLSVNGQTGAVSLTKSDVGLGNVDNTSDLSKPISTATQTALTNKASTTLSNLGSTAINTSLIPLLDNVSSIGSLSSSWNSLFVGNFYGRGSASSVTFGAQLQSRGATFTNGSADIVLQSSLTMFAGRYVWFTQLTAGALPGGINMNQRYYVKTVSGSTITISANAGGPAIVVSSAPSGTYTAWFSQEIVVTPQAYGRLALGVAAGTDVSVGSTNSTITVGSTNATISLQGATTNVATLLNMQNHIQPSASNLRDIGSSTKVFRDVYSGSVRLYGADGNFGGSIIGDSTSVGVGAAGGIDFSAGGTVSFSSGTEMSISMPVALNNNTISGVGAPSLSSDAATKGYADAEVLVEKNRAEAAEQALDGRLDAVEALKIQQQAYEKFTLTPSDLSSVTLSAPIQGTPWVMREGIMGRPGTEFTFSGSTITFAGEWIHPGGSAAVEVGDEIFVFYMKEVDAF